NPWDALDQTFADIESIYSSLTAVIRKELLQFLRHQFMNQIPLSYQDLCQELMNRLEVREESIASIERSEEHFKKHLQLEHIDNGLIYREMGLVLEAYGDWETAYTFMKKALTYRPNGTFIQKKCQEY